VLTALTRKFALAADVDLGAVAAECAPTFTGADLYALAADAWTAALYRAAAVVCAGLAGRLLVVWCHTGQCACASHHADWDRASWQGRALGTRARRWQCCAAVGSVPVQAFMWDGMRASVCVVCSLCSWRAAAVGGVPWARGQAASGAVPECLSKRSMAESLGI